MDEAWAKDAAGNIVTSPLTGWVTMPVAGMALITRLEFYRDEADMVRGRKSAVQLVWTPEMCRDFGELLLKMADRLYRRPSNGEPQ